MPSPITFPSFTTTAPTIGFGLVCPRARAASSSALNRCCASRSVAVMPGIPKTPYQRAVPGPPGWAVTNVRRRAPPAPPRARADPGRRLRPARLEHRLRAAVRLLDRRGVAFHLAGGRDVLAGPRPRLLPEPRRVHVPPLRAAAGDVRAARIRLRPAVRERHRPVRQEPHRDLDRRADARGAPVHGRRSRDLLGRAPALGSARGPRGGGRAGVRVPPGRVLARGGDRRGSPDRRGAVDGLRGAGVRARRAPVVRARGGRRRAGGVVQVHGGPCAAARRDRRARARARGRLAGARRARSRGRPSRRSCSSR